MSWAKDELKKSRETLGRMLYERFDNSTDEHIDMSPNDLLEAIERFIDAKIEIATNDLDDRINKRGMYDPDY
jgi:hypothetical protein